MRVESAAKFVPGTLFLAKRRSRGVYRPQRAATSRMDKAMPIEFRFDEAVFDDDAIESSISLMKSCFRDTTKFTPAYLRWLHNENPCGRSVGYHLYDGPLLVGQLIGIPQQVTLRGEGARVILLQDVATHPNYRGRGLFLELTRRAIDLARRSGFAAVIGVANQNTYRGYEKLGFQNVLGLDARISFFSQMKIDFAGALGKAEFARAWTMEALDWRLRNPRNPLSLIAKMGDSLVVEGGTSYRGLRVRGAIPIQGLSAPYPPADYVARRPSVVIGSEPDGISQFPLSIRIPDWAKPSPLRLIYLDLNRPERRLDPGKVLFSFLDFDAF